ncbi:MAG: glutathione S-transferase N-terminal domain-containing protein [Pseudomonadota bacterium]
MSRSIPTSFVSTLLRAGNGINSKPASHKPDVLLRLYDIENCPYCRLVREVLTELDLDALILPGPRGGGRYRPEAEGMGGKAQFPYLVDENTGAAMYESLDIVSYLFETYGQRSVPYKWRLGSLQTLGSMAASWPRMTQGLRAEHSEQPEQPLELYSF